MINKAILVFNNLDLVNESLIKTRASQLQTIYFARHKRCVRYHWLEPLAGTVLLLNRFQYTYVRRWYDMVLNEERGNTFILQNDNDALW